jgi:hypothetical protein
MIRYNDARSSRTVNILIVFKLVGEFLLAAPGTRQKVSNLLPEKMELVRAGFFTSYLTFSQDNCFRLALSKLPNV